MIKRFLLLLGFAVVVATVAFIYSPEIITELDTAYPELFDTYLGTNRSAIERLHEPAYFAEQSELVSEQNEAIGCISSAEHRVIIDDAADIPPLFEKAILASEDKTFYEHPGFDKWAIARAAFNQFVLHLSSSGASTLPMQEAKELRQGMGHRSSTKQKIGDIVMALRIEREFHSKHELLRLYVNMPYLGRGQYGIEAASRSYFGKPAKELSVYQVAFIVSLINKPALPDRQSTSDKRATTPDEIKKANWQLVLRGTRRVLGLMADKGYITDLEYASAAEGMDQKLAGDVLQRGKGCGANDYFPEHVRVSLKDRFPLNKGGLTIALTRDDGLQTVLDAAVNGPKGTVATYLARHPNDPDNGELRAGAFAVDFTGAVLAEVGNVNFAKYKYDVITDGWRQPGSTFKIFTYGGRIEQIVNTLIEGDQPPETLDALVSQTLAKCTVLDAPVYLSLGRGRGVKSIENFHSNSEPLFRGNISCALAVGESRNAAAVRVGQQAGIKNIIELTYRLGMPKDPKHILQPYPTTAIGASEVNPLGMAGAAAFMNGGFKVPTHFFNDVCKDGKSLLDNDDDGRPRDCDIKGEHREPGERLIHPAVSAAMIELLKGPLDISTGTAHSLRTGVIPGMDPLSSEIWKMKPEERKARMLSFPIETSGELAGKTGTATNADGRTCDVWLVLFVPGPVDHPEKGIMLVFWMGKDSKDHPLGERGSHGGSGFAETGGRNWSHSAATVLKFLQEQRGYLKPGNHFQPIYKDEALTNFGTQKNAAPKDESTDNPDDIKIIDPSDPTTDPKLLEQLPPPEPEEAAPPATPGSPPSDSAPD